MIRKKYTQDYQAETVLAPGGRKKTVVSYIGQYYCFAEPQQTVRRAKWVFSGLTLLSVGIWFAIILQNFRLQERSWALVLPLVLCTFVTVYELMALWRLLTAGERLTREHADKVYSRYRGLSGVQMALGLLLLAGAVTMAASNPVCLANVLFCVGAGAWLLCGLVRFRLSRWIRLVPVKES